MPPPGYVFGSTRGEVERLVSLEPLLEASTRRFLEEAGVVPGMRVLDVGCGPGTVAFLAARLVGPHGAVAGMDQNPAMVSAARARAQAAGLSNVTFLEADLEQLALETDFDAVVGRLILIHLGNPVQVLRHLGQHTRRGGIIAFQEPDLSCLGVSSPRLPTLERMAEWVREAHRRAGRDTQFGLRLRQVFVDVGLSPQLRCDAFIGSGASWGWYEAIIDAVGSALPIILSSGIATAEEADLESLTRRVRDEIASGESATRAIDLVSAWARRP